MQGRLHGWPVYVIPLHDKYHQKDSDNKAKADKTQCIEKRVKQAFVFGRTRQYFNRLSTHTPYNNFGRKFIIFFLLHGNRRGDTRFSDSSYF